MAERYIPEHRRTQFKAKNTFKPDELRRRREEQQVEIRKAKREENLAKRRGITARDGSQTTSLGASLGASVDSDDEGGTIESQVRPHTLMRCSKNSIRCLNNSALRNNMRSCSVLQACQPKLESVACRDRSLHGFFRFHPVTLYKANTC